MEEKKAENFRNLVVWQKSHELVQEIYKITPKFPRRDKNLLAQKIRDTATQIPSNIAIGFKKRGKNAKIHFYRTSQSAIEQLTYLLILAKDLEYHRAMEPLIESTDSIEKMLSRLIRSVSST